MFERFYFLRFHNAVKSGRTCIYFGKLFKNDVLRPLWTKVFFKILEVSASEKFYCEKMIKNEGTLRKVVRNMVKRVDKCI